MCDRRRSSAAVGKADRTYIPFKQVAAVFKPVEQHFRESSRWSMLSGICGGNWQYRSIPDMRQAYTGELSFRVYAGSKLLLKRLPGSAAVVHNHHL